MTCECTHLVAIQQPHFAQLHILLLITCVGPPLAYTFLHAVISLSTPAPALSLLYVNVHLPSSTPTITCRCFSHGSKPQVELLATSRMLIADSITLGLTMQKLRVVGGFVQVVSKRSSQQ